MSDRTYRSLLLLIALVAWGVRMGAVESAIGLTSPLTRDDGLDELDYELFAYQLSVGNGYVLEDGTPTARRAPGTSLFILPIYLLFGRSLGAARAWFAFLSALNGVAAAWVVRPKGGPAVALVTAAAMAFDPGMFYYALHLWSEVPYCLILTLTTGCSLRAVEGRSAAWSVCAGAGWGMALLLRPQIAFIGPCALIGLAWLPASVRRVWLGELFRQGVVAGLVIAPWLARNALVMGAPTMATLVGGHTFWGAHNEKTFHEDRYRGLWHQYLEDPTMTHPLFGSERQQERQAWDNGWRCIRRNLASVPQLLAWKVYRLVAPFEETPNRLVYWSFAASWIAAAPYVVTGLARMRRMDPGLFWWIAMHLAATVLTTLIFYGAARFRHALEPFLMMALAMAIVPPAPATTGDLARESLV